MKRKARPNFKRVKEVPTIERYSTEQEWLLARQGRIMASDGRAIFGVGYADESTTSLFEQKRRNAQQMLEAAENLSEEKKEIFQIGHILEAPASEIFTLKTGIKVRKDAGYVVRAAKTWPWLGATLDRHYYQDGDLVPVEIKGVGPYNASEWEEGVPLKVQVQVQHQIAVCDARFAWVVAFGGIGRFFCERVFRDDDFIQEMVLRYLEFRSYLERGQCPPPSFTVACTRALTRMHPNDNGRACGLPVESLVLRDELAAAKATLKEAEKRKRHLENQIRYWLGDNTFGILPDGTGWSWKTQERKEHIVAASTSRVLRVIKKLPNGIEVTERARIEDEREKADGADTVRADGADRGNIIDGGSNEAVSVRANEVGSVAD